MIQTVSAAGSAFAETWPNKPITLMVPYPPGGPSDTIARIISPPLAKELGQQVIVENLSGASGALAAQKVLAAPADGYYLFQGTASEVILAPLVNESITPRSEDFRLVHPVADQVVVFVTRKDLPVNSVDELIELAKKMSERPLAYGSAGVGSLYHFVLEDVQQRSGIKLRHVPYDGNAPLLQGIGSGQVDLAVLVYSASVGGLADDGKLKLIAQFGDQRSEALKDVPTVSEGQTLKNSSYRIWGGIMVPEATPELVVQRLHAAIGELLQDPTVRAQLAAQTQLAAAAMSLGEASRFFESETAHYRAIAKAIKLQPR